MTDLQQQAATFASKLISIYGKDEIRNVLAELKVNASSLHQYRDDPVGFGVDVLGEYYTPDIAHVMESVRDNRVTIARSSNQIGKSHSAARLAIWWLLMWDNAQVYTASAPPEANLKRILWGEIGGLVSRHPELVSGFKVRTLNIERNPQSFLAGVAIPMSGTKEERQAKFCTDADEMFEMISGSVVTYRSLIGKKIDVVSVDAAFNKVEAEAEFFDNGAEEVFEITLSSGEKFRRTGEHPLFVGWIGQSFEKLHKVYKKGRYVVQDARWIPVRDIRVGDALLISEDTSFCFGMETMSHDEIKVLAYHIGDGCAKSGHRVLFIQPDNKQLAEYKECVTRLGSTIKEHNIEEYCWKVTGDGSGFKGSNPVLNLVREHGLTGKSSGTKRIPSAIFLLDKKHTALFLNRLFSTDGWACLCNATHRGILYKKSEIGYASKSEWLVRDIQRLLFRFGIESKVVRRTSSWTHKGVKKSGIYWSCVINRSPDIVRFADKIGIYGKEEALEEAVGHAAGRRVHASWRQAEYEGFRWDKVKSVESVGIRSTVGVHVPIYNTYLTHLVDHNSGKHSGHLLFIIDEGDAVPDEVYSGIESCMSGGHVRLLIMFNPRRRSGTVWRMERDGLANVIELPAFNHPNVIYGEDRIPNAVDRETTVRRINEWTRALTSEERPSDKCFQVPSFLVGCTAKSAKGTPYPPLPPGYREVREPAFWYMVLGKYPQQDETQLISQEWINNARARWDAYVAVHGNRPPEGIKPTMGLDVGEFGPDPNVACFRYGGWIAPFTAWNDMDTDAVATRAGELYKEHQCAKAHVDATGYGSNVAPKMSRNGCSADGVKVAESPTMKPEGLDADFYQLRDQLWWSVREWLKNDPGAMLPPDEMLMEELLAPTYSYFGKHQQLKVASKDVMRDVLRRSPDRADALCLTFSPSGGWSVGTLSMRR